ncbi:TPA: hypothetical protein ACKPZ9_000723 [Stenotrophomonas maltophilia]
MTVIFIAGSITIKRIDNLVKERILNMIDARHSIILGDAEGADKAVQSCLSELGYEHVTVYCSGDTPRNNLGHWQVERVKSEEKPGSRAFFTAKDVRMAAVADFGLMIWDGKSTGTLSNVIELAKQDKKSLVYLKKDHLFFPVTTASHLDRIAAVMAPASRMKAEEKIQLSKKIGMLKHQQSGFDF